jgi:hypothetical protein
MIVGVHRRLAAECGTGKLTAAVGQDLVDVHIELRATAGHPHMQRKHVVMLPCQDLVAGLHDQLMRLVAKPAPGVVGVGRGLL